MTPPNGDPVLESGPGSSALFDFPAATERLRGRVRETPLIPDTEVADLYFKAEGLQETGSFKVRGAFNFLLRLDEDERRRGVVACSSGNHGRAVAHAARRLGIPATICVPEWVDPGKLAAIRESGATVELAGSSYDAAEDRALALASDRGLRLLHPFDDLAVVEGQGTLGREVLSRLPGFGLIAVPLSGGGLVAGVGAALRAAGSAARLVAVSAERADTMSRSLGAGRPIDAGQEESTLADALSGGIGRPNRYTFDLVRSVVDDLVSVSEAAIRRAMVHAVRDLGLVVEGGGAVALAALMEGLLDGLGSEENGPTVVVLSGSNVAPERLARVLGEGI